MSQEPSGKGRDAGPQTTGNASLQRASSPASLPTLPLVRIRDFAYALGDPRHTGGVPTDNEASKKSSSGAPPEEGANLYADASWSSSSDDEGAGAGSFPGASFMTTLKRDDCVSHVYPRLLSLLSSASSSALGKRQSALSLHPVRALYAFAKGSEWEMDLDLSEELVIIQESPLKLTTSSNMGTSETGARPKTPLLVKTTSRSMDTLNSRMLGSSFRGPASPSKLSAPPMQQQDRWASLDDDDDEEEFDFNKKYASAGPSKATLLETTTKSHSDPVSAEVSEAQSLDAVPITVRTASEEGTASVPTQPLDLISLTVEPSPDDFAETLGKFMDHSLVYGTGWVTGLRLKIKGSLQGAGQKTRGKVSVRLDDLGLVPENYIERIVDGPLKS